MTKFLFWILVKPPFSVRNRLSGTPFTGAKIVDRSYSLARKGHPEKRREGEGLKETEDGCYRGRGSTDGGEVLEVRLGSTRCR